MIISQSIIRTIEECSLSAWPALQTAYYDGWLLRWAEGYTRRANSVNPIYESHLPVAEKAAACEAFFRRHNLPTVFKLTSAVYPADLDAQLVELGYAREAGTIVQTADLRTASFEVTPQLSLQPHISRAWLEHFSRLNDLDPARIPLMENMLGRIPATPAFATMNIDGEVVAVGLGVADKGYIGLFDIVVAAQRRGQGLGYQLVTGLLAWGQKQGAHTAYLQVVESNIPAQNLYGKIGFSEAYRYWYRVKA